MVVEVSQSGSTTTEQVVPNSEQSKETVTHETHAKLLKQRKADQVKMRALEELVANSKAADEQRQQAEHEKNGEYTKIIEAKDLALAEKDELIRASNEQYLGLQTKVVDNYKRNEFMKRLPGQLADEAFEKLLPLNEIVMDPDTNTVDETIIGKLVESFMAGPGRRAVELPNKPGKMPSHPVGQKPATTGNVPLSERQASILKSLGG